MAETWEKLAPQSERDLTVAHSTLTGALANPP
jgi:hypothetical protein